MFTRKLLVECLLSPMNGVLNLYPEKKQRIIEKMMNWHSDDLCTEFEKHTGRAIKAYQYNLFIPYDISY